MIKNDLDMTRSKAGWRQRIEWSMAAIFVPLFQISDPWTMLLSIVPLYMNFG